MPEFHNLAVEGAHLSESMHKYRQWIFSVHSFRTNNAISRSHMIHFHFWTTTPPLLNSGISPSDLVWSVSSAEGKVVWSTHSLF